MPNFWNNPGQLRKAGLLRRGLRSSRARSFRRHRQWDGNTSRKSNRHYRIAHTRSPFRKSGAGLAAEKVWYGTNVHSRDVIGVTAAAHPSERLYKTRGAFCADAACGRDRSQRGRCLGLGRPVFTTSREAKPSWFALRNTDSGRSGHTMLHRAHQSPHAGSPRRNWGRSAGAAQVRRGAKFCSARQGSRLQTNLQRLQ